MIHYAILRKLIQPQFQIFLIVCILFIACGSKWTVIKTLSSQNQQFLVKKYSYDPGALGSISQKITISKNNDKIEKEVLYVDGKNSLRMEWIGDTLRIYMIHGAKYNFNQKIYDDVIIDLKIYYYYASVFDSLQ